MSYRNTIILILSGILLLGMAVLIFSNPMEDSNPMGTDRRESRPPDSPNTAIFRRTNENAIPSSTVPAMDMDEIFNMDPKEEPEKGLILIGLGIAIIFIVLVVMRYYRKKAEREHGNDDEQIKDKKSNKKQQEQTRKIETDGDDMEHLSGRSSSINGKNFRKKKHPDKSLAKAQEKLLNGSSYARKNAIKVFHRAVTDDLDNFPYIIDGLAACLEDRDKSVLKGAMKLIENGIDCCTDEPGEIVQNLIGLLDHGSEDISCHAKQVLTELAARSMETSMKIISIIKEGYKVEMAGGTVEDSGSDHIIGYNELLLEIGKKKPELISDITNILTRCFTYPIYRPETNEPLLEELYRSAAVSVAALSKISPSGTAHSLPKIMKVVADTNIFKGWKEEKDDEGMQKTFERVFETVSSSDPDRTMEYILKSASASNKVMAKTARNRIGEMAREDPEKVITSLLKCLGNREEKIRKNAMSILDEIAVINPTLSINIILESLTLKNDLILSNCASLLANLLDRTGAVSIGDISPILALADNPSREVRQSVIALLGKIVERDLAKGPQCIDHIIKGLKQEWGVRLVALSSLDTLSRADPNLRNFSIPYFIVALKDKHDQVRWRASNILRELGIEESDIKHYESAQKLMDFVLPKLKELRQGTSLDFSDVKTEIAKAREMMKLGTYGPAETHAARAKEMFIRLQVSARPELDVKLLPGAVFVVGEHTAFTLALSNTGMVHIDNIDLVFSKDVEMIEGAPLSLKAGATEEIRLAWTPVGAGRKPLKVQMRFRERGGTVITKEKNVWLDIGTDRGEAGDDAGAGVSELVWE